MNDTKLIQLQGGCPHLTTFSYSWTPFSGFVHLMGCLTGRGAVMPATIVSLTLHIRTLMMILVPTLYFIFTLTYFQHCSYSFSKEMWWQKSADILKYHLTHDTLILTPAAPISGMPCSVGHWCPGDGPPVKCLPGTYNPSREGARLV